MAVNEIVLPCELTEAVQVRHIPGFYTTSNNGNKITAAVTYKGENRNISGSVKGYVVKSDGTTTAVNGTRSGNKASITIPNSALLPGRILITVVLVDGIQTTTLAAVQSNVI